MSMRISRMSHHYLYSNFSRCHPLDAASLHTMRCEDRFDVPAYFCKCAAWLVLNPQTIKRILITLRLYPDECPKTVETICMMYHDDCPYDERAHDVNVFRWVSEDGRDTLYFVCVRACLCVRERDSKILLDQRAWVQQVCTPMKGPKPAGTWQRSRTGRRRGARAWPSLRAPGRVSLRSGARRQYAIWLTRSSMVPSQCTASPRSV